MTILETNDLTVQQIEREHTIRNERVAYVQEQSKLLAEHRGESAFRKHLVAMNEVAVGLYPDENLDGKGATKRRARLLSRLTPEQITSYFMIALAGLTHDPEQGVFKQDYITFNSKLGEALFLQESYTLLSEEGSVTSRATNTADDHKAQEKWMEYATNSKVSPKTALRNARKRYTNCLERDLLSVPANTDVIRAGEAVTMAMLEKLEGFVYQHKLSDGKNEKHYIQLTAELSTEIHAAFIDFAERDAALGFTICPPQALEAGKLDIKYRYYVQVGGDVNDAVRPSSAAIDAVNAVQAVPFSANAEVIDLLDGLTQEDADVVTGAQEHSDTEAKANHGAATAALITLATAGLSLHLASFVATEQTRKMKAYARTAKESRRLLKVARKEYAAVVAGAKEALAFDAVYFPAFMDKRTRVYSAARLGFGPQGSEVAKGLLTFAHVSTPLGEHGLDALRFELANAFGYDKLPMVARMAAAQDLNVQDIMESGEWMTADQPVKTLALCLDIAAAEAMENPEEYISAIPVGFDGTCSGIQHMSLMSRDVLGAAATNVIGTAAVRADLYNEVAEATMKLLKDPEIIAAADKGYVWASGRSSKGIRKMVKRGVMTLPYGLQENSLPKQLLDDRLVDTMAQAKELAKAMWKAMSEVMPAAMALRNWLQQVATLIAKGGDNVQWETANGSVCKPQYLKYESYDKGVRLLGHRTDLPNYSKPTGVRHRKIRDAIVPNIIHSFDATALQLTVNRLVDRGINTFSFIHDQFNCLAADAPVLATELRLAHVDIYSNDVLAALYEGFQKQTNEELPKPPAMGELLVEDVLTSPHFFS